MAAKRLRVELKELAANVRGDGSNNPIFARFEAIDLVTPEIMEDAWMLFAGRVANKTTRKPALPSARMGFTAN